MRMILTGLSMIALAACNPFEQVGAADEHIDQFHAHFSAENARAIYEMSAPEFRRTVTPEQWEDTLELVFGCLGAVEESSQSGFNISTNNGVTTTTINRDTTYELGTGTEVFTWRGTGTDMLLINWEVVSPEMAAGSECLQIDRSGVVEPAAEVVEKPVS